MLLLVGVGYYHLEATASKWLKFFAKSKGLESSAVEGNSPVDVKQKKSDDIQSITGHEKPCENMGGPPSKTKYS